MVSSNRNESEQRISPEPLTDCRVLELGSTVAGPFCGRLLADFGAEVIKVEAIGGDDVRSMGSRKDGVSLYAASILRNKKLIGVDLRQSAGQECIRRIARSCDVIVENFRPGTLERWGLGYEDLKAVNPRIILVRISGYGQFGPYSNRPGYGVICEAASGLRDITGYADRPPVRISTSLTDYITGLYGAFGALLALKHRDQTGKGQVVDAALYESAFSFMEPHITAFSSLGKIAKRCGSRLPNSTPNNIYPTRDSRWLLIAAPAQSTFRRLIEVMEMPDLLQDARFFTGTRRSENEEVLDQIISNWTKTLDQKVIEETLLKANVPVSPVYNVADIFDDPHYRERNMLIETEHDQLGKVTLPGIVPKLSSSPGNVHWAGRQVGQDTYEILSELGRYSEDDISSLINKGVISVSDSSEI